jgi:hypothetical protein
MPKLLVGHVLVFQVERMKRSSTYPMSEHESPFPEIHVVFGSSRSIRRIGNLKRLREKKLHESFTENPLCLGKCGLEVSRVWCNLYDALV